MLISLLLPNKVEMLSLCTCHISIAAAIFLTFFPRTMMCRALSIFIIKLSQVVRQFSIRQVHVWLCAASHVLRTCFQKKTNSTFELIWFKQIVMFTLCHFSGTLWTVWNPVWDCIAILLRLVIWHSHRKMLWKMDACCIFQMPSHPAINIHKVSERGLDMGLWHFVQVCSTCVWLILHLAVGAHMENCASGAVASWLQCSRPEPPNCTQCAACQSQCFLLWLYIWIWICASISNLQCHSRPPKMTVPIDIVWATPLPKPPVSCHLLYNHAAKAAKLDAVMPHALRVTRNFLLTRKACGLRTGNLAALRHHCRWCGRKSATV